MNRNYFGSWGIDLSTEDFYRALAALGVLNFLPVPSSVEAITQRISTLIDVGSPLWWHLDWPWSHSNLRPEFFDLVPDSKLLASAWSEIVSRYGEPIGDTYFSRDPRRIRLAVKAWNRDDVEWFVEQLSRPEVGATSVYSQLDAESSEVVWDWPLRVGLLADAASRQLRAELESLSQESPWIQRLVKFVELGVGEGGCDLLLLPQSLRSALASVLENTGSTSADCVLVLGRTDEAGARAISLVDALRLQVRASGIGLAHVPPAIAQQGTRLRARWFKELIRQISHNEPIDVSLYRACRNREVKVQAPFLFATRELIDSSLISRRIEQFAKQVLARSTSQKVEFDKQEVAQRGIWPTLGEAADKILTTGASQPWDHESDTATAFADLKTEVEARLEERPAPEPKTRWIQVEVWEYQAGERRRIVKQSLRAETTYSVVVYIGSRNENSIPSDRPFNEEALPDKNEHRLTVVFSEPQVSPEPQVSVLILPRQGDSSRCAFYIRVPAGISGISARIAILHRNRILQTALLRATVHQGENSEAQNNQSIALDTESVIRPGMQDLTTRSWFDAALVLNHAVDGTAQITKAVGEQVTRISISDLSATVKWFDDQITEVAEKWKKFGPLGNQKSRDLLWACSMHGSALYDGIVLAHRADDALAAAEKIQVLSARYGARFPIEFIYGRMAPLPDAPLCPKAKAALINGKCDNACPTGADEEKVICPLGFWGLNRVIERHAYDPDEADLAGADFGLQQPEPMTSRKHLNILASAVVAVSDNVDQVVSGSKQSVLDALTAATKEQSKCVESWDEWIKDIAERSPSLLVLLPHTLREPLSSQQTLEISANQRLIYGNLQQKHIIGKDGVVHPVVILMGCKTAAPDIPYESFVLKFRLHGAALVIGTGSSILGRHAAIVTKNFINDIAALNSSNVSFGELMLNVKRMLVADGLLMALCLTSYGDTDWLI